VIGTQLDTKSRNSLSRLLLQGSFNEILVFDAATEKIVEANRAAKTHLQYTLQELKQLGFRDIFVEASGHADGLSLLSVNPASASIKAFDGQLRRKDGATYQAEIRLFATQEKNRPFYVAIINDPGNREASRRALNQRESDYQALVSNIPGMAYQVHCAPDGTVTLPFVSANSRMLLGVKPQVLQARPDLLLDLIVPEDLPSYKKALAEANGCHLAFNWEGRIWVEAWKDIKWINIRTSRRDTKTGAIWDGIMLNITQSKLAKEELERSKEELRRLALHIERVKEEERKRIAREVHDELGGNLTAIKIGVSWIARNAGKDKAKAGERLKYIDEVVDSTLDAIHRISSDLRPSILDFGIVSAIQWLTGQLCRTTGIDCRFFTKLKQIPLDDDTSVAVFRIAQEAMTNIAKHAKATRVEVNLGMQHNKIQLVISDNGIGPKLVTSKKRKRSFGVIGMTERASALGGVFSIEPRPDGGTRVSLEIPLQEEKFRARMKEETQEKASPRRKPLRQVKA
jgi:signal transduction histidine kinase